ncbi:MAG: hypothetical protein JW833_11470, partial [Prolixibacteraceae bacterium]|nr:hypothetical protein [Prolixibacteraceae bacterium]
KKENKEVYFHDFEYYTTDVIKIKAGLKIGFPVSKFRNVNQFYFNTYYQKWEITGRDEDKGYITAALGIIF